ncbi:helix-turn-helix domain-containing protein [Parasutterella sp.]|uniref:helix-turn-helix domain-containing protein n=1 Tax=Parasutterella sp. TaxID=2049037 RepID=UPI0035213AA6
MVFYLISDASDLPSEAAMKSGFADQAHFSNVFNRLTGLTPGSYQKIFLKKAHSSNDSGVSQILCLP